MIKKFNRLAGWPEWINEVPPCQRFWVRDYIFAHTTLPQLTMAELKRVRARYTSREKIARYGQWYCGIIVTMIDGYIALREMGLTRKSPPRRRRRRD
jgi:hypothetical protein